MEITARQIGRIEAACYALAKLTERNDVGSVLVNTIREQLDEVAQTAYPGELDGEWVAPDNTSPDLIDRAELEPLFHRQVRDYGREVVVRGAGYATAIRLICEHFTLEQKDLADLMKLHPSRVSEAVHGRAGTLFKARFAELFGEDGGAV